MTLCAPVFTIRRVIFIAALFACVGKGLTAQLSTMSPEEATESHIGHWTYRIQQFVIKNNRLPEKLSDLGSDQATTWDLNDGWGRPFIYSPQKDGTVIIQSVGRDGPDHPWSIRFPIIDQTDEKNAEAETMTSLDLFDAELVIREFVAAHNRVPDSMAELSTFDSHIYLSTVDGWGGPLTYAKQKDGSVLVSSQGKPGSKWVFSRQFYAPIAKQNNPATTSSSPP